MRFVNPNPCIGDRDFCISVVGVHRDGDASIFDVVFDSILDEIGQCHSQLHLVRLDRHIPRCVQQQFNIATIRQRLQALQNVFRQFIEGKLLDVQRLFTLLKANQSQQIIYDGALPVDLRIYVL